MKPNYFDSLSYKELINAYSTKLCMYIEDQRPIRKVNEAVIFAFDYIVSGYDVHCTEINTNSAFDHDLVQWFDFKKIGQLCVDNEYKNIILVTEEKFKGVSPSAHWEQSFKDFCQKHKFGYRNEMVDVDDIYDFEFNERNDLILRVAWNKDCLIDQLAADKLGFIKFKNACQQVFNEDGNPDVVLYQANKRYKKLNQKSIYKKGKKYIFKHSKIDRKKGLRIIEPKNKKQFDDILMDFDFVEEFIDDCIDVETGLGVEIKDYVMLYGAECHRLTPNLYVQYREFESIGEGEWLNPESNNEYTYKRTFAFNCIQEQEVELKDGSIIKAGNINQRHKLKYGGDVTEVSEYGQSLQQKYILLNNEYKFSISTQVVHCGIIREYRSLFMCEVGDKILAEDGEVEIKSIDIIKEPIRVSNIKTETNFMRVNGFFIKSKSDNFVLGVKKDKILNPLFHQKALSADESGILTEGIIDKIAEEEFPERVVEITFESYGTYFTSEFLFEKPLKVINSTDKDIRDDRRDGLEPFGTHTEGGGTKSKPTFGWASYRPDLTFSEKHMEVMRLRVGMICLTPKRDDMKITTNLYGEMVPARVVKMREVLGKKSHWDIYDIQPTNTYFMNRMHVHNGPSVYTLQDGANAIGHWDIFNPSSYPGSGTTFYDLTSRLNADFTPTGPGTLVSTPIPNTYFAGNPAAKNIIAQTPNQQSPSPAISAHLTFSEDPSNPYHTADLFGTAAISILSVQMLLLPGPSHAGPARSFVGVHTQRPGNDLDFRYHAAPPSPAPQYRMIVRSPTSWVPTGDQIFPLGTHPSGPKVPAYQKTHGAGLAYDGASGPNSYRFSFDFNTTSAWSTQVNIPASAASPRTSSTKMNWGGINPPNSTRFACLGYQQMIIWDALQPASTFATQYHGIAWEYGSTSPIQPASSIPPMYF